MMQRVVLLLFISFLFAHCATKEEKKPEVVKRETNELPHLSFSNLDGTPATTRDLPGSAVIILFNTDCDHCQREAKSIQENLPSFEKSTLLFIASDPVESIQKFARDYGLDNHLNVRFGRAEGVDVYMNFGSIPTPAIYVYSKEKRLVKSFLGETPVDQIILSL